MSIGKSIKKLRESKDMSLEDVAKLCNTTRQTIYKYENEIVTNIPYDRIESLSKALNTTPAYLMGWEEEKETLTKKDLSESEQKLIELFRKVPEDRQDFVMKMIEAAIENL
jgi:transcriptional regulator with XRE-family HTH domain